MSELIPRYKYNRMLIRRVKLVEKKLDEIHDIKIRYGTVPNMGGIAAMKLTLDTYKDDIVETGYGEN